MFELDAGKSIREFGNAGKVSTVVIRCSFGGANESFVVSGSEHGSIYIYHKETGVLVAGLDGHKKTCCNAVTWNPTNPSMFASAGDDGRVKIWSNKEHARKPPKISTTQSNGSDQISNGW